MARRRHQRRRHVFPVRGEFVEIDPPRKLVHAWRADWDQTHVMTVIYCRDVIANGTRVTLRHEGFAGRPESCQGHTEDWESVLEGLQLHFATRTQR